VRRKGGIQRRRRRGGGVALGLEREKRRRCSIRVGEGEEGERGQGWEGWEEVRASLAMARCAGPPSTPSPVRWPVASRAPWCRRWTSSRSAFRSVSSAREVFFSRICVSVFS
jgi:hypothetical protein